MTRGKNRHRQGKPAARPTALVTGASSGIGAAVARTLVREGWTVYASARDESRLADAVGLGARPLVADFADPGSTADAVSRLLRETGGLDLLVNNAGYGLQGSVEDVSTSDAARQLRVNVLAPAQIAQAVLPGMIERGRGRIITVSSVNADLPQPLGGWYGASKAALGALMDSMRLEAEPYGVRVVDVRPGPVDTGWHERAASEVCAAGRGGRYQNLSDRVARRATERAAHAVAPEAVADVVLRAALTPRPKARYFVGRGVRATHLLSRIVPPRVLDAAVRRYVG